MSSVHYIKPTNNWFNSNVNYLITAANCPAKYCTDFYLIVSLRYWLHSFSHAHFYDPRKRSTIWEYKESCTIFSLTVRSKDLQKIKWIFHSSLWKPQGPRGNSLYNSHSVVKPRPSVLLAGWAITHAVQQSHRGVGAVTHAVQQSHRGAGDLSADWRECREDDLKLKGRIITGQLGASLRWNRLIAREQIILLELLHRTWGFQNWMKAEINN